MVLCWHPGSQAGASKDSTARSELTVRLSPEEFATLVEEALADIPPGLAHYLKDVVVDVEPMPDRQTCRSVGVRDRTELLGLYLGTPLTERGLNTDSMMADRIVIYQRNIERLCRSRAEIIEQVRTTVFHEVGHHFGLSEEDLEALGYE